MVGAVARLCMMTLLVWKKYVIPVKSSEERVSNYMYYGSYYQEKTVSFSLNYINIGSNR